MQERDDFSELLLAGFEDGFRYLFLHARRAYTFWQYGGGHKQRNEGWRLDYFLVSKRVANKIISIEHCTKIQGSDHSPITFTGLFPNYAKDPIVEDKPVEEDPTGVIRMYLLEPEKL